MSCCQELFILRNRVSSSYSLSACCCYLHTSYQIQDFNLSSPNLYFHQRNVVGTDVAAIVVKIVVTVTTAVTIGLQLLPKLPTWKVSQKQSSPRSHNAIGLSRLLCLLLNTEHKLSEHGHQTRWSSFWSLVSTRCHVTLHPVLSPNAPTLPLLIFSNLFVAPGLRRVFVRLLVYFYL